MHCTVLHCAGHTITHSTTCPGQHSFCSALTSCVVLRAAPLHISYTLLSTLLSAIYLPSLFISCRLHIRYRKFLRTYKSSNSLLPLPYVLPHSHLLMPLPLAHTTPLPAGCTRTIGSGSLVDLTVLIDEKLSATAAHAIGERARWQIMERLPQVRWSIRPPIFIL